MLMIKGVLYRVGSGEPVDLPLHHMIVFGVTEFSGKTTFIESAVSASGYRGLTFRTKRGELGFEGATKIPIFFDDKGLVTWRNLIGLMNVMFDAHIERIPGMEFAIQQICLEPSQAKTLKEIEERIVERMSSKKISSFKAETFGRLLNYLKEVTPELDRIKYTDKLAIGDTGLYMMDLEGVSDAVKNLIIASTLRKVHTDLSNVVVVIPEAKKYIPRKAGTPTKWIIGLVLGEGRSVGNYVWVDTQNMKGVDTEPARNIDVRLFGRQPDAYEIKELLKALPMGEDAPSTKEMMTLNVGEFYAKLKNEFVKVYARPVWLPGDLAVKIAKGELAADSDEVQSHKNLHVKAVAYIEKQVALLEEEDWSDVDKRISEVEAML